MDRLAGRLRIGEGAPRLEWSEGCVPIRMDENGAEAVALGPAGRRRDDLARRLTRISEDPASALAVLRSSSSGYAFALWEPSKETLLLGSDPLGVQSLYYSERGEEIRFGARLAEAEPPGPKRLQLSVCEHYLLYLSVPPGKTLLGGVRRVSPGGLVRLPGNEGEPETLFPLRPVEVSHRAEAAERIRLLLEQSLRVGLEGVADVEPVGLLLSGGLDSTALLATLRSLKEGPIVALHVSAPGNPDREYAREMAAQFEAEFLDAPLEGKHARDALPWIVACLESPGGNPSAVATSRAFTLARERGLRRVFSGLGGDELFAGHGKHLLAPWWPRLARLPRPLRLLIPLPGAGRVKAAIRRALAEQESAAEMHRAMYSFFGQEDRQRLRGRLSRFAQASPIPWRAPASAGFPGGYGAEILQVDLNLWLRAALAPMAGTLAAANGIELVLPFCTNELIALSAHLPLAWKVRGRTGKRILQEALSGIVPEKIFRRPRRGFTVPADSWLRDDLAGPAREWLAPERVEKWGFLDPGAPTRFLMTHMSGTADWSLPLWGWMTFSLWYERFVEGAGGAGAAEAERPGE